MFFNTNILILFINKKFFFHPSFFSLLFFVYVVESTTIALFCFSFFHFLDFFLFSSHPSQVLNLLLSTSFSLSGIFFAWLV